MSKKQFQPKKLRLDQEYGTSRHRWNEGRYRIALVYPNTYFQGMSNLGFLTVYHLLNQRDDCLCERFFLPEADENQLVSLESGHRLSDFDLIAFSSTYFWLIKYSFLLV